ncbi:MAG TPA: hypothetical protein DCM68_05260, partial [Verrucomicrobia bacterium]|nr:hypothetical protein [Verrucomicrobiota bacterium]
PAPPPILSTKPPTPEELKRKHARARFASYYNHMAWALFIVLGGAMAAIKYGGWVDYQYEIATYGPWVILGLHLVVAILAFMEELFAGVLCLIIPGYSLYYLLARSGRPFLCALVCGLLVGLGEDTFLIARKLGTQYYDQISGWISDSGKKN